MRKSLLNTLSLFILFLFAVQSQAQQELVKDINPGGGWAEFEYLFHIGDNFYFAANGDSGREVWISDGTPDGTEMLLDINVGFIGSNPNNFVELNGAWYFSADNGVTGAELWKTDGTAAGTSILKDIHPGFPSSDISEMVNIGGLLYFQANDGANGFELWVSDGTTVGTNLLMDINPGASSSSPEYMTLMGTDIYFAANDGTNGKEIWKTDGTALGTSLVADVFTGTDSSFPMNLTAVGNFVYFTADDGLIGSEIYKTDGTAAGTILQGDINPGIPPSNASDLTAVGNYLFLVANDGTNGTELWRSDAGSATADLQMLELFPGDFSALPSNFIKLNGDLLFNANDGTNGYELWKANASDGTVNLVKNISPDFYSSFPVMLDVLNGEVIFSAKDTTIGVELWKTDGTEAGTVLLGDLNPHPVDTLTDSNPQLPFIRNDIMYFTATDNTNGWQIWQTDGTMSATQRLTNIPHDTIFNNSYKPYAVNSLGNTIINFVALGDAVGEELWKYSLDPVSIANTTSNSPLACAGDTNGTFDVEISGGVGDPSCFTYTWSDPTISGLSATDLSAGDYVLTVTDCVGFTVSTTVVIEEPMAMVVTTSLLNDASCFGEANGSASAATAGGVGPYTYVWDNAEVTEIAAALTAGLHSVTASDANGCTEIQTVMVGEPTEVVATVTAGPAACFGGAEGTATADGSGGNGLYTYSWDNGEMTATAVALTGGDHTVTVTDGAGCSDIATVSVLSSAPFDMSFNTVDVLCIGANTGSATAMVAGGSGMGYTYLWETGAMTELAENLAVGTYTVTVTDSNGCTGESMATISGPTVSTTQLNPVSCGGSADGQAEVSATAPGAMYTYAWDNGETTAIATMLLAGVHTVTISEASGCSFVEMVTIADAVLFELAASDLTGPSCPGVTDGAVTVTPTGGVMPYSYTWSNGDVTDVGTFTGLAGGVEFCVTITEAGNCGEIIECVTPTDPAAIENVFQNEILPGACSSACDGSVEVITSGGDPVNLYDYVWSNGETTTDAASSMATGLCEAVVYYVTVTDGVCTVVDSFFFDATSTGLAAVATGNDVSCFGDSDGSGDISVTGGEAPYTFDGPTTDLPAGDYTVTVTDAGGCTIVVGFQVGTPDEMMAEVATTAICFGASNGSASIIVSGGTAPYSFSGPTEDLEAGSYIVTVTDTKGCILDVSFDILEGEEITATGVSTPAVGGDNGSASVENIIGGIAPYLYSWESGSFQVNPTIENLGPGDYTCEIQDANGCISTIIIITVDFLESTGDIESLDIFELLPNPAHSNVSIQIEFDNAFDVKLDVVDALGRVVERKNYGSLHQQQIDLDVSAFAQGVYMVRLKTSEGQVAKRLMVVRE